MTTYDPFFIVGHPRPKGSWTPVRTKAGPIKFRHASNKTADWCKNAATQVGYLWKGPLLDGPIVANLEFFIPRLKTVVRRFPTGRREGDGDKLDRAIWDAMTGIVYVDDSQVVKWTGFKQYTDGEAGVWVQISTDI